SMYPQKKFSQAAAFAKALLEQKNIGADDKALSNLTIARDLQMQKQNEAAIQSFKNVLNVNKGAWAAEARYGIAEIYFEAGNIPLAEKAAFEVINKSGSYDFWVTRAYILLGDIYFRQKDFFNAKATFQSVALNAADETLKKEANEKLALVNEAEKKGSKVEN
ncbi:MAG: tetratricopeptide repeat protein, partial [Bacteroidetes bacterium]|nr:tetratricopeptide repeat protein [Bacteroidota bacterium]